MSISSARWASMKSTSRLRTAITVSPFSNKSADQPRPAPDFSGSIRSRLTPRHALLFPRLAVESFQHLRVVRRVREGVAERRTVEDAVRKVLAHPNEVVFAPDLVIDGVLPEVVLLQERILLQKPKRIIQVQPALRARDFQKVAALEVHPGIEKGGCAAGKPQHAGNAGV